MSQIAIWNLALGHLGDDAMVSAPDGHTFSHSRQEVQFSSLVTVDLCETISRTAVGQALTQQAQPTQQARRQPDRRRPWQH